jgi:hypothetical protein
MKIRELLALLKDVDSNMEVVVAGYEAGYDDPIVLKNQRAYKRDYIGSYLGKYDDDPNESDQTGFACVCIGRTA